MKIKVGQLRKLIAEAAMTQMKLGVASSHPPPAAWGDFEDDNVAELSAEDPTYIATELPMNLEPDDDTKEQWRQHIQSQTKAGFDDLADDASWGDEEEEPMEVEPWELEEPVSASGVRAKKF